jgi:WhiB family redox-sensing transcriptional regulator
VSAASRPVYCVCCNQPGLHVGRGLIVACHSHHSRNGTLTDFPPMRGNPNWPPPAATRPALPNPPADATWQQRGACRQEAPNIWFPISYDDRQTPVQKAKTICRGCPVLAECGQWVQANPQTDGIWAATTPPERRRAAYPDFLERTPA